MSEDAGEVVTGSQQPRVERRVRGATVAIGLAALALVAAACGSGAAAPGVASLGAASTTTQAASPGGGSSPASSTQQAKLLRYSECMRSHGLADFPDPSANGGIRISVHPGSELNPSSPQFQAAQKACQSLMPGALTTPAEKAAANAKALLFSQCMRAHGITDFPDPNGQGVIDIQFGNGLNQSSSQYEKAQQACQSLENGFDMIARGRAPGGPVAKGGSGS